MVTIGVVAITLSVADSTVGVNFKSVPLDPFPIPTVTLTVCMSPSAIVTALLTFFVGLDAPASMSHAGLGENMNPNRVSGFAGAVMSRRKRKARLVGPCPAVKVNLYSSVIGMLSVAFD